MYSHTSAVAVVAAEAVRVNVTLVFVPVEVRLLEAAIPPAATTKRPRAGVIAIVSSTAPNCTRHNSKLNGPTGIGRFALLAEIWVLAKVAI